MFLNNDKELDASLVVPIEIDGDVLVELIAAPAVGKKIRVKAMSIISDSNGLAFSLISNATTSAFLVQQGSPTILPPGVRTWFDGEAATNLQVQTAGATGKKFRGALSYVIVDSDA